MIYLPVCTIALTFSSPFSILMSSLNGELTEFLLLVSKLFLKADTLAALALLACSSIVFCMVSLTLLIISSKFKLSVLSLMDDRREISRFRLLLRFFTELLFMDKALLTTNLFTTVLSFLTSTSDLVSSISLQPLSELRVFVLELRSFGPISSSVSCCCDSQPLLFVSTSIGESCTWFVTVGMVGSSGSSALRTIPSPRTGLASRLLSTSVPDMPSTSGFPSSNSEMKVER